MRPGAPVSIVAAALLLAACGSTTSDTTTPTDDAPAPVAAEPAPGRPSDKQLAAFTKSFTAKYPELAGDRSAKAIGHDADNTCLDLSQGADKATLIKRVQARFTDDVDVSIKTAGKILTLIKAKACPE